MIKISHEVPLALLKESRKFNDYDYCLCHLFNEIEEYRDFYKEGVKNGRHVLLDNSIFELGTAFDSIEYAKIISELKPTEYIVPDVTDDAEKTIESYKLWEENYGKYVQGTPMGVVHGKTYEDIKECMRFMIDRTPRIAFNFHGSIYESIGTGPTIHHKRATGRNILLQKLDDDLLLPYNKSYHLLGCALPTEYLMANEYTYYKGSFTSLDTSNPIVHGICNISYEGEHGLSDKQNIKLADLIHSKLDKTQKSTIIYNISMFRKIIQNSPFRGNKK